MGIIREVVDHMNFEMSQGHAYAGYSGTITEASYPNYIRYPQCTAAQKVVNNLAALLNDQLNKLNDNEQRRELLARVTTSAFVRNPDVLRSAGDLLDNEAIGKIAAASLNENIKDYQSRGEYHHAVRIIGGLGLFA